MCNETPAPGALPCGNNTEYLLCKADIKRDLVTATAAIAALGTACMGIFANLYVNGLVAGLNRGAKVGGRNC